jgi:hypothetical protein
MWNRERIGWAINVAAALAMIGASGLMVFVLLDGRAAPTPSRAEPPTYKVGEVLEVIDTAELAQAPATLVMFLREGCRYCNESMDFYKRLSGQPRRAKLLVAGRESVEKLTSYVNDQGFRPDGFTSIGGRSVKVAGTPTLLLVSPDRTIKAVWRGKLDAGAEAEVVRSVQ